MTLLIAAHRNTILLTSNLVPKRFVSILNMASMIELRITKTLKSL